MTAPLYEFEVRGLDNQPHSLGEFKDRVLLIVNTASHCGYTPQYAGLERLFQQYRDRGLTVLGFPCNQFGQQEPGTAAEIRSFCDSHYGVTFPMFEKVEVNGDAAHPLYRYLTAAKPGLLNTKSIKWNFTKFLIDRSGTVVERYAPAVTPEELEQAIQRLL